MTHLVTWEDGFSPFITLNKFFLTTTDSAAQAAAVLLVGILVQSPIPNTLPSTYYKLYHTQNFTISFVL